MLMTNNSIWTCAKRILKFQLTSVPLRSPVAPRPNQEEDDLFSSYPFYLFIPHSNIGHKRNQ